MARRRNAKSRPRSKLYGKRKMYRKGAYKRKRTSLVKTIKRVISAQAETKVLQYSATLPVRSFQASTTQAQVDASSCQLVPQGAVVSGINCAYPIISMGTDEGQRIGDQMYIKGIYVDYLLQALDYDAGSNPTPKPQIVTFWVVKPKTRNALGLAANELMGGTTAAIFFENQANGDSGFSGSMFDLIRRVDKANYTVLARRTYKIGWQGGLNTSNSVSSLQVNDYKQFVKSRIKISGFKWKCDRTSFYQGRQIYMFATCHNADNITAAPTVIPVDLTTNTTIYYTDM